MHCARALLNCTFSDEKTARKCRVFSRVALLTDKYFKIMVFLFTCILALVSKHSRHENTLQIKFIYCRNNNIECLPCCIPCCLALFIHKLGRTMDHKNTMVERS